MNTDTPETDAALSQWGYESTDGKLYGEWVSYDHARRLERERDTARAVLRLIAWLEDDERDCAQGLAMEALERMPTAPQEQPTETRL